MADSANSPSSYLKLSFALVVVTLAALVLWARSEQRHATEWHDEFARQQAQVEAARKEAEAQRTQAAQYKAIVETQEKELRNLRTTAANAAQNVTPNPRDAIPFVPFVPDHVVGNGKRSWGPEQATGEPDTLDPGDHVTAWASLTEDGQPEWLVLDYAEAVTVAKVKVYENYKPGALSRVTSVAEDGKETELWKGIDPTPPTAATGVSEVTAAPAEKTKRIKIYIDSQRVVGWNEIDAVGIVDDRGKTHWAVKAEASSTYARQGVIINVPERPLEGAPREF